MNTLRKHGELAVIALGAIIAIALNALGIETLWGSTGAVLAASYTKLNATTAAELAANDPKVREELWVRSVLMGGKHVYQDAPFEDNFRGGPGTQKACVEITETTKVAGNTVNVPLLAGFGGPGVVGEGERTGNEQKIHHGNLPVKIGRIWFGGSYTSIAGEETIIGGKLEAHIKEGMRYLHAKKRSDDCMMRMIQAADTAKGRRNKVLPDGAATFSDLKTEHVTDTNLIVKASDVLPGIGALAMNITRDASGSKQEHYVYMDTHRGLRQLQTEPAYVDAVKDGDVRGDQNRNFTGQFRDWLGIGIYRWYMRDHANKGPIGSPLEPRALLGVALTNAGNGTVVQGGGFNYSASDTPVPQYFEFFQNAPYTFYNGDTIAADTSTTRHLIIINSDGSYGVFPYVVNDAEKITISGAALSIGVGTETDDFEQGALIAQCNAAGQTWGRALGLGGHAVACGRGTINGKAQMGRLTQERRNHDMDLACGVEGVYGDAAVIRHDGTYPNFVVVEKAIVAGGPTIQ